MELHVALGVQPGDLVALVGAGGKTSAAWRLLHTLAAASHPVVFSTTTHVFEPQNFPLLLTPDPTTDEVIAGLGAGRALLLAAGRGQVGQAELAAHSVYPAHSLKLAGLSPQVLDRLAQALPQVTWLVEADGARGRLVKAPAEHEPLIPASAGRVIVVAGLAALGQPLDERVAHRPELIAQLLEISPGTLLEPDHLARLIADPRAGCKGIPAAAEIVVLLSHRDEDGALPAAQTIAQHLIGGRIRRVVAANLRNSALPPTMWKQAPETIIRSRPARRSSG